MTLSQGTATHSPGQQDARVTPLFLSTLVSLISPLADVHLPLHHEQLAQRQDSAIRLLVTDTLPVP